MKKEAIRKKDESVPFFFLVRLEITATNPCTAMTHLIEYEDANDEVRAVYDDIRATRKTEYINNFWKAIANHPPTLQRTWQNVKEVMTGPGELDPLTRELIYIALKYSPSFHER